MSVDQPQRMLEAWRRLGQPRIASIPGRLPGAWSVTTSRGERYLLRRTPTTPRHPGGRQATRERILRQQDLIRHLARARIPVASWVPTDDGQSLAEASDGLYTLEPVVANDYVPPEASVRPWRAWAELGGCLGRLHRAAASWPGALDLPVNDLANRAFAHALPAIAARLAGAIGDRPAEAFLELVDRTRPAVVSALVGLSYQPIHGDCRLGNVLTVGGQVTGFVGFDKLQCGPRCYDIAHFLAGRLFEARRDAQDTSGWLAAFPSHSAAFIEAYDYAYPLSPAERTAIGPAALAIELLFLDLHLASRRPDHVMARLTVDTHTWLAHWGGTMIRGERGAAMGTRPRWYPSASGPWRPQTPR